MKRSPFRISDHAVMRYLQRVKGIDIEAVRSEIAETVAAADGQEGCTAVISNGFRYPIVNDVIVTVHSTDMSGYSHTKRALKAKRDG